METQQVCEAVNDTKLNCIFLGSWRRQGGVAGGIVLTRVSTAN